ncbi:hypothetical protein N7G274_005074 [Stereocaulon virgatum]|uniref:Uncharacterized protein n=1 Tax=Stereocaulon virgatum TaxID=373712 RepID=A0ABR4A7K5_9LECA
MKRERTFLERQEWMTIPWSKHTETKTPRQQLLDVLACLGGVMEDFDNLESVATNEKELRAQRSLLWEKLLEQLKRLYRCRWDWEASHNGPVAYEVPVDRKTSWTVDENLKPIYDTLIYFTDFAMAHELLNHNPILLIIRSLAFTVNNGPSQIAEIAFLGLPANEEPTKLNPLTMLSGNNPIYLDAAKESMRSVENLPF